MHDDSSISNPSYPLVMQIFQGQIYFAKLQCVHPVKPSSCLNDDVHLHLS